MTQATRQLSVAAVLVSIYLAALLGYIPLVPQLVQDEILPVLPLWALVTFGAYLLSRIGIALLFFNDVPEAANTLQKEIEQARTELRAKGVDVD